MKHLLLSRQAPAMVEQGDDPRYNLALGRISAIYSLHTRGLRPTVGQAGLLRIQQRALVGLHSRGERQMVNRKSDKGVNYIALLGADEGHEKQLLVGAGWDARGKVKQGGQGRPPWRGEI